MNKIQPLDNYYSQKPDPSRDIALLKEKVDTLIQAVNQLADIVEVKEVPGLEEEDHG